jgi:hypothetical protein
MKKIFVLMAGLFLLALPLTSQAALFTFSGSDEGGTGSATLDISITGNTLTAILNNTSPVDLDGGSDGGNSPGISIFGFDRDPDSLTLGDWMLTDSTVTTIGDQNGTLDWTMAVDKKLKGVKREYQVNNGGIADGALFNPLAVGDTNNTLPGGVNDVYFTTATLTMEFSRGTPTLVAGSPYVRMQNVGLNGDGSLKLTGTPVPEPATMLLLGVGLIGLAGFGRKRILKKK